MLDLRRSALILSLVLVLSAAGGRGLAQGPGAPEGLGRMIGAGGGVSYVMVMMAPAVQQELKLTDEQKTKLFELAREAQQRGRAMMQSVFQAGGNAQMMLQMGGRLRQENEANTAKILKPEQKERLDQIMLQIEGPLAVARPEVAGKLNLTAKQNQQVQATMMQLALSVREIVMANGGFNGLGPAGIPRQAMNQLRASATRQLSRILDAKQKFNFNKMLGPDFDLAKIDPELAQPATATTPTPSSSDAESVAPASKAEKAKSRRKNASAAAPPAAGSEP